MPDRIRRARCAVSIEQDDEARARMRLRAGHGVCLYCADCVNLQECFCGEDRMRKPLLAVGLTALLPMFAPGSAGAAELRLYGGGHFQGSGKSVAEAFVKKTGVAASYTPGNTG